MRFLQGSAVLAAVQKHAAQHRLTAAVAYVGDGAFALLQLKAGDLIVVNGSVNALANGATSARVLRSWVEQGVEVYVHEKLHAKVFVVGGTAFVGSANLSARASQAGTAEAAIETTDAAIVAQAREFVRDLAYEEATAVDHVWLEWAVTVPVRRDAPVLWNPNPPFEPEGPYDIWLGPEDRVDYSRAEHSLAAHARELTVRGSRYGVMTIAEYPKNRERLEQPDMVVLIRPRSTQLVRFLERTTNARAAMGFYRTDRDAIRLPPSHIAEALGLTVEDLQEEWICADRDQRAALIDLYGLPDHPPR